MLAAIIVITLLAGAGGALLNIANRRLPARGETVADAVDALLPQTQCAQCGYPGCRPYANAIAAGEAPINQCPPGGQNTIDALARLLGQEPRALDPATGITKPPQVAVVREAECIGCALCIKACPVDAIIGAGKRMHTVLTALCTGCELCLPPCPVDCIDLRPVDNEPSLSGPLPSSAGACVNCGACAVACPVDLQPQRLLRAVMTQAEESSASLRLDNCIECGACDAVCPARIPLLDCFSHEMLRLQSLRRMRDDAAASRRRHEAREQRLALQANARAARLAGRSRADTTDRSAARSAVAAAVARANQKRRAQPR